MVRKKKFKNKFEKLEKKIKDFIHKNEVIDKIAFFAFGLFWIARAKFIFKGIRKNVLKQEVLSAGKNTKILILAIRTIPSTNLVYFDAIFGHGFRKLGCDVRMLYCDGFLDSCDADTVFRNQKAQCSVCKKFGPSVKNALAINHLGCISYCDYISDSDVSEIKKLAAGLGKEQLSNYEYLGVNVGMHARIATIRYFLYGEVDLDNPKEESVFREKLAYAMISAKIASVIFEKENPDIIFMLHGIYSSWGPFLSYFRQKGKEAYVYDNRLSKLGYFTFHHNCEPYKAFDMESWRDFSRLPLKKEEETQLDAYLGERFSGKVGEYLVYKGDFNNESAKNYILKSLLKNNYARRYVLYPNVGWDGSIKGDTSEVFENMFDWIDKTIDFFKKNKDKQLIIKSHPAEIVSDGCNITVEEHIIKKHGLLPDNIAILKPDVPLKAYDIIGPETICLTYDGTIGLELALLGFPVLAVAETHYRDTGVVKRIKSLDEYFKLLEDPAELIAFGKSHIELARKYAYFYFFKLMVRIPFYKDDKWSTLDWKKIKDADALLSEEGSVIKICKKIINKQDVLWPL